MMWDAPPRRQRVLMLTTQLGYGGAETSFVRLANLFAEKFQVTVALLTREYGSVHYSKGGLTLTPNCQVVILDTVPDASRLRRWWTRWVGLRRLKREHDITISFLSGPNILNVLAGRTSGTVVSLRGSRVYDTVMSPWMRRLFQYVLDPITLNLAARIVPISLGLTNEVVRYGGPWTRSKVRVIPPFVLADEMFRRAQIDAPDRFRALKGQPVVVAVGRLSVEKGFHHLIRVFADLSDLVPGAKLLLIGDGPMMETLRSICSEEGLAVDDPSPGRTAVLFAGYQEEPVSLMALSRVLAMTSATEGFGNVMVEALAAGLPVVAADTPWGARAVLSERPPSTQEPYPTLAPTVSDFGILMPRVDLPEHHDDWVKTLQSILRDPEWARELTDRGQERVRHFDISRIGSEWWTLIDELRWKSRS